MITIQEAGMPDCALIHKLAACAFPATYASLLSPAQIDYMMEWMYAPAAIAEQFAAGHRYFLAWQAKEPCGYVSVEQEEPGLFHLQKIYVLPAFQGKGIGKRLFDRVLAHIRSVQAGPCVLELNVNRENSSAIAFYTRQGMRIDRSGDFAIGEGFFMRDHIMRLEW